MRPAFTIMLGLVLGSHMLAAAEAARKPMAATTSKSIAISPKINNGLISSDPSAVALFVTPDATCTATLIGCQVALTAAHCVCAEGSNGSTCVPNNPAGTLFFQHSGIYPVESVAVHPNWSPEIALGRHDLAVLHLANPVAGVQPTPLNTTATPSNGTQTLLAGFGITQSRPDGIKRIGEAVLGPCLFPSNDPALCYDFVLPIGMPGEDSTGCPGDSGGPMFVNHSGNLVLAGVTSGGQGPGYADCSPPVQGVYGDIFPDRAWVQSHAGGQLAQSSCGGLPNAGSAMAPTAVGSGELSASDPGFVGTFEVPNGTAALFVTLNAELYYANDFDLYLNHGTPPSQNDIECQSVNEGSLEGCLVASPQPGTWYVLAQRYSGQGIFQITATAYKSGSTPPPPSGDPPPPNTPALTSASLPGFAFWARISGSRIGTPADTPCPSETVCVSGAIPTRAEVFVRIVGPKANGRLWPNIVKFNTTRTEIWIKQLSSGKVKYYDLPALSAGSDTLPGLIDKDGFVP